MASGRVETRSVLLNTPNTTLTTPLPSKMAAVEEVSGSDAVDCLLNCLSEVKLERFHQNFTSHGIASCDELARLSMQDYQRYGVTGMEDRVRLFKLIQIIKTVQSDGLTCQHPEGGESSGSTGGNQQVAACQGDANDVGGRNGVVNERPVNGADADRLPLDGNYDRNSVADVFGNFKVGNDAGNHSIATQSGKPAVAGLVSKPVIAEQAGKSGSVNKSGKLLLTDRNGFHPMANHSDKLPLAYLQDRQSSEISNLTANGPEIMNEKFLSLFEPNSDFELSRIDKPLSVQAIQFGHNDSLALRFAPSQNTNHASTLTVCQSDVNLVNPVFKDGQSSNLVRPQVVANTQSTTQSQAALCAAPVKAKPIGEHRYGADLELGDEERSRRPKPKVEAKVNARLRNINGSRGNDYHRNDSGSPVFDCRKRLDFSNPDLYSDEESEASSVLVGVSMKTRAVSGKGMQGTDSMLSQTAQPVHSLMNGVSGASKTQRSSVKVMQGNHITSNGALGFYSSVNSQPSNQVSQSSAFGPLALQSAATGHKNGFGITRTIGLIDDLKPAGSSLILRLNIAAPNSKPAGTSLILRPEVGSSKLSDIRPASNVVQKEIIAPVDHFVFNSNTNNSRRLQGELAHQTRLFSLHPGHNQASPGHAYFPLPESDDASHRPPHVEKVVRYNAGYNYGVPSTSSPSIMARTKTSVVGGTGTRTHSEHSGRNVRPERTNYSEGIVSMDNGERNALRNDLNARESNGRTEGKQGRPRLCADKIRVCMRKRPRNARELKRNELDVVKVNGGQGEVVVDELKVAVNLTKYIQQHILKFDEAFDEWCSNEEVYERAVRPLIAGVFNQGSAVCFAFGQTGAGKTYTLLGSKSAPGMFELAGADLFAGAAAHVAGLGGRPGGAKAPLRIWASYYEIYCGHIYDLFNKRKRLHLRENNRKKVCIAGLMENNVHDVKALVEVIQYGNTFRSRGATGVNAHSSRSHALLQLEVRDSDDFRVGRLTFIDLAGSERASDAANGDRQTRLEGAEINQSLLALKECIRSLDQQSGHTPYRQSKLTLILRDSFLGHSQTVMIANVSPTLNAAENTLNTLRYADRVQELRRESAAQRAPHPSSPPLAPPHIPATPPAALCKPPPSAAAPPPSLFHPQSIQSTSTPLRNGATRGFSDLVGTPEGAGSPDRVLHDVSETPISGHQLGRSGRGASSGGVVAMAAQQDSFPIEGRISPIHNFSLVAGGLFENGGAKKDWSNDDAGKLNRNEGMWNIGLEDGVLRHGGGRVRQEFCEGPLDGFVGRGLADEIHGRNVVNEHQRRIEHLGVGTKHCVSEISEAAVACEKFNDGIGLRRDSAPVWRETLGSQSGTESPHDTMDARRGTCTDTYAQMSTHRDIMLHVGAVLSSARSAVEGAVASPSRPSVIQQELPLKQSDSVRPELKENAKVGGNEGNLNYECFSSEEQYHCRQGNASMPENLTGSSDCGQHQAAVPQDQTGPVDSIRSKAGQSLTPNNPKNCASSSVRPLSRLGVQAGPVGAGGFGPRSNDEAHVLFTQTKACMANARDNIREFLDGERLSRCAVRRDLGLASGAYDGNLSSPTGDDSRGHDSRGQQSSGKIEPRRALFADDKAMMQSTVSGGDVAKRRLVHIHSTVERRSRTLNSAEQRDDENEGVAPLSASPEFSERIDGERTGSRLGVGGTGHRRSSNCRSWAEILEESMREGGLLMELDRRRGSGGNDVQNVDDFVKASVETTDSGIATQPCAPPVVSSSDWTGNEALPSAGWSGSDPVPSAAAWSGSNLDSRLETDQIHVEENDAGSDTAVKSLISLNPLTNGLESTVNCSLSSNRSPDRNADTLFSRASGTVSSSEKTQFFQVAHSREIDLNQRSHFDIDRVSSNYATRQNLQVTNNILADNQEELYSAVDEERGEEEELGLSGAMKTELGSLQLKILELRRRQQQLQRDQRLFSTRHGGGGCSAASNDSAHGGSRLTEMKDQDLLSENGQGFSVGNDQDFLVGNSQNFSFRDGDDFSVPQDKNLTTNDRARNISVASHCSDIIQVRHTTGNGLNQRRNLAENVNPSASSSMEVHLKSLRPSDLNASCYDEDDFEGIEAIEFRGGLIYDHLSDQLAWQGSKHSQDTHMKLASEATASHHDAITLRNAFELNRLAPSDFQPGGLRSAENYGVHPAPMVSPFDSAFTRVAVQGLGLRQPDGALVSNGIPQSTGTVNNSNLCLTPRTSAVGVVVPRGGADVVQVSIGFVPIEPFPLTEGVRRQEGEEGGVVGDGVGGKMWSGRGAEVWQAGQRSQSLMIGSHEEQLSAVTMLCKQEMGLLIAVKSGSMSFEDYIRTVQEILSTKAKIIDAFTEHIQEFRQVS